MMVSSCLMRDFLTESRLRMSAVFLYCFLNLGAFDVGEGEGDDTERREEEEVRMHWWEERGLLKCCRGRR
jgi:hypothetical protein